MEDRNETVSPGVEERLESALKSLLALLETEREALLAGDAKQVAGLSQDKERIASSLPAPDDGFEIVRRSDVVRLAKRVGDLAASNHILIEQMYRHYNGMLELIMRMAGQAQTYGPNGAMTEVERLDMRSHRVVA
jgi:flagellar biosynthesis/type III secretory pathway chaperone